jgi:hypothetical protein
LLRRPHQVHLRLGHIVLALLLVLVLLQADQLRLQLLLPVLGQI